MCPGNSRDDGSVGPTVRERRAGVFPEGEFAMISGHIGTGHYILFQRDPAMRDAPMLEVGRLVVAEVDGVTRVEHWFLYTNAPIGSGYAPYVRPNSAFQGTPVGLSFRGAGAVPSIFDANAYMGRLSLATGCSIEYIRATCDRLSSTVTTTTTTTSALPGTANQVDLGIYDIVQGNRRVGVLVVTRTGTGMLEKWHLFARVPSSATNESVYCAPDASIGGAYALVYVGSSTPDLSGRAVVTVNALCAAAA
jgi:hypothetical protein